MLAKVEAQNEALKASVVETLEEASVSAGAVTNKSLQCMLPGIINSTLKEAVINGIIAGPSSTDGTELRTAGGPSYCWGGRFRSIPETFKMPTGVPSGWHGGFGFWVTLNRVIPRTRTSMTRICRRGQREKFYRSGVVL